MSNVLLRLGTFSFQGLESPERIHLKSKQRLAVHHLGSGISITDCLGEDCEIATFQGIFSGANAEDRIRSIDYLRLQAVALALTWGSTTLSVLIRDFELDYSSDLWIPYRLTCHVVRSIDPGDRAPTDDILASPATQVSDVLGLLQDTDVLPLSEQAAALVTLASLNYDVPSFNDLGRAQELVRSINNQIMALRVKLQGATPVSQFPFPEATTRMNDKIGHMGSQIALILARSRVMNIVVQANSLNQ